MARRLNTRFLMIGTLVVLGLMVGALVATRLVRRGNAKKYMDSGLQSWNTYQDVQKKYLDYRARYRDLGLQCAASLKALKSSDADYEARKQALLAKRDQARKDLKPPNLSEIPELLRTSQEMLGRALQRMSSDKSLIVTYGDVLHQAMPFDPTLAGKDTSAWEQALEIDPAYEPALRRLLDTWVEISQVEPTVVVFKKVGEKAAALARETRDPRARAYQQISLINAYLAGQPTDDKSLEASAQQLRKLMEEAPDEAEIPYAIARLRLRQAAEQAASTDPTIARTRRQQAQQIFQEALKARPDDALLLYYDYMVLGSVAADPDRAAAGDPERDRQRDELIDKAANLVKPEQHRYTEIHLQRAMRLAQRGRTDEAEQAMRDLLDEQPEAFQSQQARLRLARMLDQQPGHRDEAIKLLTLPVASDPTQGGMLALRENSSFLYHTLLDRATYRLQAYPPPTDREKEDAKRLIDEDYAKVKGMAGEDTVDVMKLKGQMLLILHDDHASILEALRLLQKAYDKIAPRADLDLTWLLATAYGRLGQEGQAISLLDRLTSQQPANTELRLYLARLLISQKQFEKARPHIDELSHRLPNDPNVQGLRIFLLANDAKFDEARKLAEALPATNDAERIFKGQAFYNAHAYNEAQKLLAPMSQDEIKAGAARSAASELLFAALIAQDKKPESLALAQQVLGKKPKDPQWTRFEAIARGAKSGDIVLDDTQDPVRSAILRFERDRWKKPDAALAAAQEAAGRAPSDGRIPEAIFDYAIAEGKLDLAGQYAETLAKLNWDQAGGLAYQASLKLARGDVNEALETATTLSRTAPEFARTWVVLGQAQQRAGQYEDALASYAKALEKELDNAAALQGRLECNLQTGDRQAAQDALKRGLALGPPRNRWFVEFQKIAVERGNPQALTQQRESDLKADPDSLGNYYSLAENYLLLAKVAFSTHDAKAVTEWLSKSQQVLSDALAKWPDELLIYERLANLSFLSNKPDEGLKVIQQAQLRPKWKDLPDAWLLLARYQAVTKGGLPQAEQSLLTAVEKSKNSVAARRELAQFYLRSGQADKGIALLTKLAEETNSPTLRRLLTEVLVKLGRYEEAERWLRESLRQTPANANVLALLGFVKLSQGLPKEALDLLTQAVRADSKDAPAHYYLGMTKLELGDWINAGAELEQACNLRPADADIRAGLAELYVRRNRTEDACRELQAAIRADPRRSDLRQKLITLYFSDKRWLPAEDLLEQVKANPETAQDPTWWRLEAVMWLARDNPEKALSALDAALKLKPDDGEAWNLQLAALLKAKAWQQVIDRTESITVNNRPWWMHMRRAQAEKALGKTELAQTDFERAMSAVDSSASAGPLADAMADDAAEALTQVLLEAMPREQVVQWLSVRRNPRWNILLARLYFANHDSAQAVKIVDAMLGRDGAPLTDNQRLRLYEKAGQIYQTAANSNVQLLEKARQAYIDYLDLLGKRPGQLTAQLLALNNLAMLLAEYPGNPRPGEALVYSRRAYDIMTKANIVSAGVLDTHGWVLVLCNKLAEGIEQLKLAIAQKNPPPEAFYHLGQAMLLQGRPLEAEANFRLAKDALDDAKKAQVDVDPALAGRVEAALQKLKGAAKPAAAATAAP